MDDEKTEDVGGFDAKNNAKNESKDSAGKAVGYEDEATRKREDKSQKDSKEA